MLKAQLVRALLLGLLHAERRRFEPWFPSHTFYQSPKQTKDSLAS